MKSVHAVRRAGGVRHEITQSADRHEETFVSLCCQREVPSHSSQEPEQVSLQGRGSWGWGTVGFGDSGVWIPASCPPEGLSSKATALGISSRMSKLEATAIAWVFVSA